MAGSMEFRVNGMLTHHISLQNLGVENNGKYFYNYEFYEYEKEIIRGKVVHKRDDGMIVLIQLILQDVICNSKGK